MRRKTVVDAFSFIKTVQLDCGRKYEMICAFEWKNLKPQRNVVSIHYCEHQQNENETFRDQTKTKQRKLRIRSTFKMLFMNEQGVCQGNGFCKF